MQVGEERRCWEEGKGLIMDTSFVHSTRNDTDETRYVLITRFWHPALAKEERKALQFIFDCLDDPTVLERGTATQAVMQAKTKRALRGKSQQRKKQGGSRRKR